MNEVLLCPPSQLKETTSRINPTKAEREHKNLIQTYESLGVIVRELPQKRRLPDMLFTSQFGVSIDHNFISANPPQSSAKEGAAIMKDYFKTSGFTIAELPTNIAWAGQRDLLKAGDVFVLGHGQQTEKRAKDELASIMEVPKGDIIDLELTNPHFPHLDTALAPLNRETALVNPHAFDKAEMSKIQSIFPDVIHTTDHDNQIMGCNVMVVNNGYTTKTIVKPQGISEELKHEFKTRGFQTKDISTEELRKTGGSVKSLTLALYRSTPRGKVTVV